MTVLNAQDARIHLRVLNGKSGKPEPFQRILFFGDIKPENSHAQNFAVTTDKDGLAVLSVDLSKILWLQAFPDFRSACYPDPNEYFFNVREMLTTGLSGPNSCSKTITQKIEQGNFTLFVRKPTLREMMDW